MNILNTLRSNIIDTDSYKVSHWRQYPEGTEYVSSYIEARSSRYAKALGDAFDFAQFFGLQAFLTECLAQPVTQDDIDLAELVFEMHGEPFNREGWQYILDVHGGRLPLEVRALPEGTVARTSNAMVEIINTDPKCFWLTSYVEPMLLRAVWYPTTVSTKSRVLKEICRQYLQDTADTADGLDFMLHDFGARGVSSMESSVLGGMAHLVNFSGTDTVMGMMGALGYYNADFEKRMAENGGDAKKAMIATLRDMKAKGEALPAFSVEASEHSTMTIKGRDGEAAQVKALIDRAKTGRIVSIVSDSYDYFRAVEELYGTRFRDDMIEVGKNGGRVVIRPDSGDPVDVVVRTLQILERKFGVVVNGKGYKVLPPFVRVLQGDGIDLASMHGLLEGVKAAGFSVENVVCGMGGGLLQKPTRDDLNFAQKASAARIKGEWYDVYKDPATADAQFVKKSKRGRLSTVFDGVAYRTIRTADLAPGERDAMAVIFRDGQVMARTDLATVRATAEKTAEIFRSRPSLKTPKAA